MTTDALAETLPLLYLEKGRERGEQTASFLEEHGVSYRRLEVGGDATLRAEAERKAAGRGLPVLDWRGVVLAGFGAEELIAFLRDRGVKLEES